MSKYPKDSYQETNSKNRQAGLSATPITSLFKNRSTDPNLFLSENQQNTNQALYNTEQILSKGIVNDNNVKNPKNPREYGLYMDRKEFKLEMPLYPNIADNVASENVSEYVIIIDSSDRNTSLYPSPFVLKAFFSQDNDSLMLNIPRSFENVKFLRIENVILPRQYFLQKYTVVNLVPDPVVPDPDKAILISVITEILTYTNAVPEPLDVPSSFATPGVLPVEAINLKIYTL